MSTFCCPNCQHQTLEELKEEHVYACTTCYRIWVIAERVRATISAGFFQVTGENVNMAFIEEVMDGGGFKIDKEVSL